MYPPPACPHSPPAPPRKPTPQPSSRESSYPSQTLRHGPIEMLTHQSSHPAPECQRKSPRNGSHSIPQVALRAFVPSCLIRNPSATINECPASADLTPTAPNENPPSTSPSQASSTPA